MHHVLLRDTPEPPRGLHIAFWMHAVLVAVAGGLFGPTLSERALLLVGGWLIVAGLVYLALWKTLMRPEYVVTDGELRIHYGLGAPERHHLSRISSVDRQTFTLGSLRRFRANRWRDGVEVRIDGLGAYWLAPANVEEFIRVLNEARGRMESRGSPQA
jgi:hypothetical protein